MANIRDVIRNNALICQRLNNEVNDLKNDIQDIDILRISIQSLEEKISELTEQITNLQNERDLVFNEVSPEPPSEEVVEVETPAQVSDNDLVFTEVSPAPPPSEEVSPVQPLETGMFDEESNLQMNIE